MEEESQDKMYCPHCDNQIIDEIWYSSNVRETGTIELSIDEHGNIEYGDMDTTDSDTQDTDYECPNCQGNLHEDNIIIKKEKSAKIPTYKIGEKVILKQTKEKLTIISTLTKTKIICEDKTKRHWTYFTHQIEKINKRKEIDNGNSETEERIISKKEEESFKIDPLLQQGSICPECKHFFAEGTKIRLPSIEVFVPEYYGEKIEEMSTCPKCKHEFNRLEEYKKILTNK